MKLEITGNDYSIMQSQTSNPQYFSVSSFQEKAVNERDGTLYIKQHQILFLKDKASGDRTLCSRCLFWKKKIS